MRRSTLMLLVAALAACQETTNAPVPSEPSLATISPPTREPRALPGRYVVVLDDDVADPHAAGRSVTTAYGGAVHFVYRHALKGFAATLPVPAVRALRANPHVARVEPDLVVYAVGSGSATAASWGLDRIDQRSGPLDGVYNWNTSGQGVTVYIIDTGIRFTHAQFGGRARPGYDAVGDGWNGGDCNGHGTHVAGIAGGSSFGVARDVALVSVRVLDCDGAGSLSGVIAGVDWVTGNRSGPAVANMSLAALDWLGFAYALDQAVGRSIASGVSYAVAAANDAFDACYYTPARVAAALTVGASDQGDARAYFSNYGSCVDWFAPGVDILSAWNATDNATLSASGTSMATPHTAGVAALYLELNPQASPSAVFNALYDAATKNVITDAFTPDNHLLYNQFDASTPPPPPPPDNQPPVADFTASCSGLSCGFTDGSSDADGAVVAWSWTFGDGSTGGARNPSHTYAAAGSHEVRLVVTDDAGAVSTPSTQTVTVSDPNELILTATVLSTRRSRDVRLDWAPAETVDVWRARAGDLLPAIIASAVSGTTYADTFHKKERGSYLYFVCETGNDERCSNLVEVSL